MDKISTLLNSVTNRLIIVTIVVYIVIEAVFANMPSGLELYYWESPKFKLWQLVSYMFLHGSLSHLLFNMIGLWSFGRILEKVWGGKKFLLFYFVCGVGAAVIHLLYNQYQFTTIYLQLENAGFTTQQIKSVYQFGRDISAQSELINREVLEQFYRVFHTPAVGASGAIYGVLVAFGMLFPNFKIVLIFLPIPIAAKYFVPVLLLIDLSAGITGVSIFGYNIAHFAHLGGAIAGFILVTLWLKKS